MAVRVLVGVGVEEVDEVEKEVIRQSGAEGVGGVVGQ